MMVLKSRAFIQLWSLTFQKYEQICNADVRFYKKFGKHLRSFILFGKALMGKQ